jgi:hypothetical protein
MGAPEMGLLGVMPMSFADPQTVTIAPASALSLPRTQTADAEGNPSIYRSADGLTELTVSHESAKKGRTRRLVKISVAKLAADPFRPSENRRVSMSTHVVFDVEDGFTAAEQKNVWDGFIAMLNASSGLLVTKVLAGES